MNYAFVSGVYPGRVERWVKTEYFCPFCAKKAVWEEDSPGDYYAGPTIMCIECGGTMQHPTSGPATGGDARRVEEIRKVANDS